MACLRSRTTGHAETQGSFLRRSPPARSFLPLAAPPHEHVVACPQAVLQLREPLAGATAGVAGGGSGSSHRILAPVLVHEALSPTPEAEATDGWMRAQVTSALTGMTHAGVPYFFLAQTYDTAVANELLAGHNIKCPSFGDYAKNLLDFVDRHPKL